jgi:hypothetical protein
MNTHQVSKNYKSREGMHTIQMNVGRAAQGRSIHQRRNLENVEYVSKIAKLPSIRGSQTLLYTVKSHTCDYRHVSETLLEWHCRCHTIDNV